MKDDIRYKVADSLIRIGAVHFRQEPPFRFTSGTYSPVYVDCRRPISFVLERNLIISAAVEILSDSQFDVIAGGETAGIPYAAILAHVLGKEMVYVRKQPKGFGKNLLIEGEFKPGSKVLLVEDLTFDAQSKVQFCSTLRGAGAVVNTTFSVFNYGLAKGTERLHESGLTLAYLTDWNSLLEVATRSRHFTSEQAIIVRSFLEDPEQWTTNTVSTKKQ